jgi:hypothetical protein
LPGHLQVTTPMPKTSRQILVRLQRNETGSYRRRVPYPVSDQLRLRCRRFSRLVEAVRHLAKVLAFPEFRRHRRNVEASTFIGRAAQFAPPKPWRS